MLVHGIHTIQNQSLLHSVAFPPKRVSPPSLGLQRLQSSLFARTVRTRRLIPRQRGSNLSSSSLNVVLTSGFALLAAREVALFAGHDSAGVDDIQEDEGEEHHSGVEDVLVGFVYGDCGVKALRVFDEAEYDTDLPNALSSRYSATTVEEELTVIRTRTA